MSELAQLARRVALANGDVGYVEEIDPDGLVRIRLQTPRDAPSCCSTWAQPRDLREGAGVVPMPRSAEWYAEAMAFAAGVADAFRD